jgi:hypothetical protein
MQNGETVLNNVKDFGATGNGTTNDRLAIQNAIDDAAADATKAGIFFPAGTYRVSRVNVPRIGGCSLELKGVEDFMVMGEGPKSVVKLINAPNPTGDWHVFLLYDDCRRVVFKDLVLDGNRSGLARADEHSAGIQADAGTEDLVVDRCILRHCFGDGLRILRTNKPQRKAKRLRIENCLFQKNKRSGIAIQRGVAQIIIANCVFNATVSDNSIDIEPSDDFMPTDVIIQGCIINHTNPTEAVHLAGTSQNNPLVRCKFVDNIVLGGAVVCVDVSQLTIQNNTVIVSRHIIPVELHLGGDSVVITGNMIITKNTRSEAVIALKGSDIVKKEEERKGEEDNKPHPIRRVLVANNLCIARSGSGITFESGIDVAIQGNMIVATGSCVRGISLKSAAGAMDNIAVRDNDIIGRRTAKWTFGISISPAASTAAKPFPTGYLSITGNSIRNAATGVIFENDNFRHTPVCALNRIADDVKFPIKGIGVLPTQSLIVGGATSRGGIGVGLGGGRFIAGLGFPNKRIIGNVGDIFQCLDGKRGKTLWVKEEGNNTKTGWAEK